MTIQAARQKWALDWKNLIQVIALSITLMLSACGFHLRGQQVLAPHLHCLKLESATPYGDFESILRRTLTRLGVQVTRTNEAPIILHIINASLYQDVPTIGGSNQARVYVYYYQVNFEILDSCRHPLLAAKSVTASETLIVNAGTALESTNQLEVIKLQMYEEASHMMLNILNSPQLSGVKSA